MYTRGILERYAESIGDEEFKVFIEQFPFVT